MTIYKARRLAFNILKNQYEADLLLAHVLNVSKVFLLANPDHVVDLNMLNEFEELLRRRKNNEPLQYILGYVYFMNVKLYVDNNVLIPRQDTETLVIHARELVRNSKKEKLNILDMCTGSGCIAISLAYDFKKEKKLNIYATDISEKALHVAERNAKLNNVENITFIQSDYFSSLPDIKFDYILSNPPYIAKEEIRTLEPQVKDFEPEIALDGGLDGLDAYKKIISQAKKYLSGSLLLEAGINQAQYIANEMEIHSYSDIFTVKDLNNIDRVVHGLMN
ncbi:MAG TPA: peptide chain release factor N(5)-glutamine methyltransferase [Clostridiaceae bacterium]|jgi:release factor glutamine methyltransferase|nr:peptide chain release factor N(5)-glutamine methyltransferase [Clostridiaceae bacterium]HOA30937.1 peptide chain release factor N(5)-glutamine methyltransferase [Clostridia bacterium]